MENSKRFSSLSAFNVAKVVYGLILVLTFSLLLSCKNADISDGKSKEPNQSDAVVSFDSLIHNPDGPTQAPEITLSQSQPTTTRNNFETVTPNKNTFETYVQMGIASFTEKKYMRSVDMFTKAIELNSRNGVVFFHRGNSYLYLRQYEEAIVDFDMALQFERKVSQIYNSRGRSYLGKGDHKSAIRDFNSAIELDPSDPIPFYNRGSSYQLLGQRGDAIADFSRAIELDSSFVYAYYNRGRAYKQLGNKELAELDFDMTCKLEGLMC